MQEVTNKQNFFYKLKRSFFPFYKSKEIKIIFNILKNKSDINDPAMLVGGCVRKYLSNEEVDDIDIATIFEPEQVIEKFKDTEVEVKKTGLDHGTLTLVLNKKIFEITTLREDISTDGRHAKVSYTKNWTKDSERRDFTINAIYLKQNGKVFDPQLGVQDLKNKKIRFIGDPDKRIKEDYLRILRFVRFSIQYENKTRDDIKSFKAVERNLNGILKLSKERIYTELKKILALKNFKTILEDQYLSNIFKLIFPELKHLDRVKNFEKIKNFIAIDFKYDFFLALLLTDSSNNHEYFYHKYRVSNETKNNLQFFSDILKLINQNKNFFKNDLKKNIFYNGKEKIKYSFLFYNIIENKIEKSKIVDFFLQVDNISIPKFPISGSDILNNGITSGKKVGEILKKIEKKWIENNFQINEEEIQVLLKRNI